MKLWKIVLVGFSLAAVALAQGGGGGGAMGSMGGSDGGSKGGGGDMGASMGMQSHVSRLDRMTQLLKLNKDQKKSVKSIMDDGEKEAAPVREQMTAARASIAEAVGAGKPQPDIDAAVKSYAQAEAQMTSIELHAFAKIYTGLERDQQNKVGPVLVMMAGAFKTKNWNE